MTYSFATQILFAAEEYPELKPLILRKFKEEGDVEMVLVAALVSLDLVALFNLRGMQGLSNICFSQGVKLLNKSDGIQRARELAIEHAEKAASCVSKL